MPSTDTQVLLAFLSVEYKKLEDDFATLSNGPADQRARCLGKMAAIKGLQEYIGKVQSPAEGGAVSPTDTPSEPDLPDTGSPPSESAALRALLEEQAGVAEDISDEEPQP